MRTIAASCLLALTAFALAAASDGRILASGLLNPIGLALSDAGVLVAEAGPLDGSRGGRVLLVAPDEAVYSGRATVRQALEAAAREANVSLARYNRFFQ